MLLRCIENRMAHLPGPMRAAARRFVTSDEVNLQVGARYVALGVVFRDGSPWFLVCEGAQDAYPVAHIAGFFSIVDSAVGEDWHLAYSEQLAGYALLPSSWSHNDCFMEELIDGDEHAQEQLRIIREVSEARHR